MSDWDTFEGNGESRSSDNDERTILSAYDYKLLCERLSGIITDGINTGRTKSILTYQQYEFTKDEAVDNDKQIFFATDAKTILSYDVLKPDMVLISIIFDSPENMQLKLLWAKLQKYEQDLSVATENLNPVFNIHLLERESVNTSSEGIVEASIINPIVSWLTRESPSMKAEELLKNGDLMGGNVIKLLCPASLITFSLRDDINVEELEKEAKAELKLLNSEEAIDEE